MKHLIFRLNSYLKHSLRSFRSKKGYGVHSPFAFSFITEIINPDTSSYYYCYEQIEHLRYKLKDDSKAIKLIDGKQTTVSKVASRSATTAKDGQILFRTALYCKSKHILELGTSLGIGSAYMACNKNSVKLYTIDHHKELQALAQENLKSLGLKSIQFINDSFEHGLKKLLSPGFKVDLAFIDGHHMGDATLHYFNTILPFTHKSSLIIFHDIHWSKDMYTAWMSILKNEKITASFECYNMGIVFLNPELNKEHYYA